MAGYGNASAIRRSLRSVRKHLRKAEMGARTGHFLLLHECQRTVRCHGLGMLGGALVLQRLPEVKDLRIHRLDLDEGVRPDDIEQLLLADRPAWSSNIAEPGNPLALTGCAHPPSVGGTPRALGYGIQTEGEQFHGGGPPSGCVPERPTTPTARFQTSIPLVWLPHQSGLRRCEP